MKKRFGCTLKLYATVVLACAIGFSIFADNYHDALQDQAIAREIRLSGGDAGFESSRMWGAIPGRLTHVRLYRWPGKDITALAKAERVRSLIITGGHSNSLALADLSAIGHLTNLEYLAVADVPATKLVLHPHCRLRTLVIENCPNLVQIYFKGRSLPLYSLNLHKTAITDLKGLGCLHELRKLSITQTPLKSESIAHLSHLERLQLTDTKVSDISFLGNLSKLKELHICPPDDRQVTGCSSLLVLRSLGRLSIQGASTANVEDISVLSSVNSLSLHLYPGVTILPLARMKGLKTLSLTGVLPSSEEIKAINSCNPNCDIRTH